MNQLPQKLLGYGLFLVVCRGFARLGEETVRHHGESCKDAWAVGRVRVKAGSGVVLRGGSG